LRGILKALTETQATTDPKSDDRRLRGRTYAIPFEKVWQATLALCGGGVRGWSILSADDQRGVVEAISKTLVFGLEDDVRVEIQLDQNAQTRVDLWSGSRKSRANLGRNRRLIGRFLRRLDRRLDATADQILDPTRRAAWHEPE